MPSFSESIFLFVLALLLFGPKKLPVLARELGKWVGEFRRASNEFKMQMEEELRSSEQADRQKQIAAMEAAAPIPPPLSEPAEPPHPHLRYTMPEPATLTPEPAAASSTEHPFSPPARQGEGPQSSLEPAVGAEAVSAEGGAVTPVEAPTSTTDGVRPLPIATSGSLKMMPPDTGLPTPRNSRPSALGGLIDAIPESPSNGTVSLSGSRTHAD